MLCLGAEGEWVLSTEQPPATPAAPAPAVGEEEVEKPPHAGPIAMELADLPRPNRQRHGRGLYRDGANEYIGDWKNDRMHGQGTYLPMNLLYAVPHEVHVPLHTFHHTPNPTQSVVIFLSDPTVHSLFDRSTDFLKHYCAIVFDECSFLRSFLQPWRFSM